MTPQSFKNLSLTDKESYVTRNGTFVYAEDYYSYRILLYALDNESIELVYDFSGKLMSVEFSQHENDVHPSQR